MKKILIVGILFFININTYSQITKGNWLVGGNARFSTQSEKLNTSDVSEFVIDISPNIGYFFKDKLAGGIRSYFAYSKLSVNAVNGYKSTSYRVGLGPFVRYYFLPTSNTVNLLGETSFLYESDFKKYHPTTFSISAGPAIYFNSSVGMEFLLSYEQFKSNASISSAKTFSLRIGFQIHLEKDTN